MMTFIALLRAINVGGYRKIKMADLRNIFEEMGFKNVKTYIQSGNVVFNSDESDIKKLSHSIEEKILIEFGHEAPVIIRTREELKILINNNPFDGKDKDPYMLYVTFFLETPSVEKQKQFKTLSGDIEQFEFLNGELFSLIDKATDQKTNFSNNYVEKIVGIPRTGRNWRSVNKIFEMTRK